MSIFWELHQHTKIHEAKGEANRAHARAREATYHGQNLERKLDKAFLICEALWSFMHERLNISEHELYKRIQDIDLSDGVLDGKVRRPPRTCPSCERITSRRHPECLYCGEPMHGDPFEV